MKEFICLVLLAACGSHRDDTMPPDARGATDGMPDAPPACTAGISCTPDDACHRGFTSCNEGHEVCVAAGPVDNDVPCDGAKICQDGQCVVACDPGFASCSGDCVGLNTSAHCGSCTNACDPGSSCSAGMCTPGNPVAATGTCTYIDQPGWLSCPTGMSCRCYFHYYKLFENQPGHLDAWLSPTSLQITGGTIPMNSTLFGISATTIPLSGTPATGNVYPYQVTVGTLTQVKIYATSGYVPEASVLFDSADCGNRGKLLQCTFTTP